MAAANPIALGVGALSSLLPLLMGGGPVTNPYAGEAQSNFGQAQENAAGLSSFGQGQMQQEAAFQPEQLGLLQKLISFLQTPLNTNSVAEAAFNRSNANAAQGWEAAKANMINSIGSRGIVSPQGGSSELGGGLADVAAQQAGSNASIQNQNAWQMLTQYLGQLTGASQAATGEQQALAGQGLEGLTQGGELANQTAEGELGMGQQQIQNTQNAAGIQSGSFAGLGGLAGLLASLYGKNPNTATNTAGASTGGASPYALSFENPLPGVTVPGLTSPYGATG
jgi:hypothetical protein